MPYPRAHTGRHWYTIHTKPHKEFAVRGCLECRGIEIYLPLLKEAIKSATRRRLARPFFACYLFAHLDLGIVALSSINWSPGVNRVVSFGRQPAVVPDEVIAALQARLAQTDPKGYFRGQPLRPGDRLRVTEGPLKYMEAIFDQRLSSQDRARVLIEMLGRLTTCTLELDCLERINK